jgi:hypothetical protein
MALRLMEQGLMPQGLMPQGLMPQGLMEQRLQWLMATLPNQRLAG